MAAVVGLCALAAPRAQAQDIYWTTNGAVIMGADIDGSNVVEVFDGSGAAGSAVDVAVTATHIYWTDKNDTVAGGVWRAARDGAGATLFISNPGTADWAPQFIAIDEANDRLYFSCYFTGLYSATLSDGSNVTSLGSPSSGTMTGLALRGSNELLSVDGTASRQSLYSTNISEKTHGEIISWLLGDGGYHGLAYDPATDTAYYTDFGGTLYLYNLTTDANETVLTGLGQPLGIALSASKSHLLYVERTGGTITAYDLAQPSNSFMLVAGGAYFGVGIDGDPQQPPPTAPAELPVVDTFNAGTPGSSIVDQATSDGNAFWRQSARENDATLNYGGESGAVTFEPFTANGHADIYLDLNVDGNRNFNILFDDVLLRGGRGDVDGVNALSSRVTIGARKSDSSDLGAYRIGQWHTVDGDNYTFRYGIHYVDPDGVTHIEPGNWVAQTVPVADVNAGDYSGSELLLSGLELRVRGSTQQLFLDGNAWGPVYPTQGSFDDRLADRALVIHTNAAGGETTFFNPVFEGVTVDPAPEPPPAIAGWQKIDDFEGRSPGNINEQGAWSVPVNHAEVIENPYGPGNVLLATGTRTSHLILIPEGETGTIFFRARPFGNDDFSFATTRSAVLPGTGASAGQLAFRASGKIDIVDNLNPNHIKTVGQYAPHTWYDVWMVINNGTKKVQYHVRGGEFAERTLMADSEGTTEFNHRSTAEGDILSFGFQGFARAPMLVDEIWINAIEADVTDPSPAPQDTEPTPNSGPLLAYEGFNYAPGPILRQNGGQGWIHGHYVYGTDLVPNVESPGFTYNDLQVSGNRLVADNPGSTTGAVSFRWLDTNAIDPALIDGWGQLGSVGTTYVSVLAKGGDPTESRFWGFGLFRTNQERIFLGKGSNETEGWHFREQSAPALNREVVTSLSLTAQHFLIIKLDQDAGKAYLFANPDLSAGEPANETAEAVLNLTSTIGNWGFNNIRTTGGQTGISVDEVRIGTTWDSVMPTGVATEGFAAWQDDNFGPGADPAISGPEADPDGDGIKNVMEYALGSDPLVAGTGDLPDHGTIEISGATYLTLTFDRPIGLTDVDYQVDASSDLVTWGAAVLVGTTDNGDGTEEVVYRHPDPISASSRGFLSLEATLN